MTDKIVPAVGVAPPTVAMGGALAATQRPNIVSTSKAWMLRHFHMAEQRGLFGQSSYTMMAEPPSTVEMVYFDDGMAVLLHDEKTFDIDPARIASIEMVSRADYAHIRDPKPFWYRIDERVRGKKFAEYVDVDYNDHHTIRHLERYEEGIVPFLLGSAVAAVVALAVCFAVAMALYYLFPAYTGTGERLNPVGHSRWWRENGFPPITGMAVFALTIAGAAFAAWKAHLFVVSPFDKYMTEPRADFHYDAAREWLVVMHMVDGHAFIIANAYDDLSLIRRVRAAHDNARVAAKLAVGNKAGQGDEDYV